MKKLNNIRLVCPAPLILSLIKLLFNELNGLTINAITSFCCMAGNKIILYINEGVTTCEY